MKIKEETTKSKIKKLMRAIGIDGKSSEVVDLSNSSMVASSIEEVKVSILTEKEKDLWLYFMLKKQEGRSIVFCNSITGVLRLRCHILESVCKKDA
jgi:superfamily II DNA/RNA helicase